MNDKSTPDLGFETTCKNQDWTLQYWILKCLHGGRDSLSLWGSDHSASS